MPREFLPMAPCVIDSAGLEGDYTWFHKNCLPIGGAYHSWPRPYDSGTTITDADVGRTYYVWKKDYTTFVEYYATNSDVFEVGVGSRLSGQAASAYGPKFAAFGPTLYVTNGMNSTAADRIHKSTGGAFTPVTTQTDSTGATSADIRPKFLIAFKNQLVAANITVANTFASTTTQTIPAGTYKHLVWWSCPENVEAFGSELGTPTFYNTGYQPIFDESIEITGLCAGEDAFFVFKEHGIYRFDGPPLGAFDTVTNAIGCIAPNSIQRLGNLIIFLSQCGLTSINVKNNEIEYLSKGSNQRSLLASSVNDVGPLAVPDYQVNPNTPTSFSYRFKMGNAFVSSAVSPEWGLYYLAYRAEGNVGYPRILVYSTDTKEFGLRDFEPENSLQVIGCTPATHGTSFPGGTLVTWAQDSSTHTKYKTLSTEMDVGQLFYVRWPFLFQKPNGKVSIRAVRPIFSTGYKDTIEVKAEVMSMIQNGATWQDMGIADSGCICTVGTGEGNDHNLTFANCPYADSHSIGIGILISAGNTPDVVNFRGIEVEYEVDLLINR